MWPAKDIGLHCTDCDFHVKRVLTWSDGTDFDTGLFLVSSFFCTGTVQKKKKDASKKMMADGATAMQRARGVAFERGA